MLRPRDAYPDFQDAEDFLAVVRTHGYRPIAFRDPRPGEEFIAWGSSPIFLKTLILEADINWCPPDPRLIVEKL